MQRPQNRRSRPIRIHMPRHQPRYHLIQMRHIRQSPANNDCVWIKDIHDHRQGAGRPVRMPRQRRYRPQIPRSRPPRQQARIRKPHPIAIRRQRGPCDISLDTSHVAAETCRIGQILHTRPGQGRVPPLPADPMPPRQHRAIHHQPAPTPRPQDHPKHHPVPGARAIGRFRQRETIRIVLHPNLAPQRHAQIPIERMIVHPDRVRIQHQPRRRTDRPRYPHPYAANSANFRFGAAHQRLHARYRRVVSTRVRHAPA